MNPGVVVHIGIHIGEDAGGSRRDVFLAKKMSWCVGEIDGLAKRCGKLLEPCATAGFVCVRSRSRRGGQGGVQHSHHFVGPHKIAAQDQHGRDQKRQALRDPETKEDLGEQSSHGLSISCEFAGSRNRKLVSNAADGLDLVSEFVGGIELVTQAADVHVEAAIEGMKFTAQDGFRKLLPGDDFAGAAHEGCAVVQTLCLSGRVATPPQRATLAAVSNSRPCTVRKSPAAAGASALPLLRRMARILANSSRGLNGLGR